MSPVNYVTVSFGLLWSDSGLKSFERNLQRLQNALIMLPDVQLTVVQRIEDFIPLILYRTLLN